eukprot:12781160-Alexandrium_andersonii.AAC.1
MMRAWCPWQDISKDRWLGANQLLEFYMGWARLVVNINYNAEMEPTVRKDILLGLMGNFAKLSAAIFQHNHLPGDDPRKSYDALLGIL